VKTRCKKDWKSAGSARPKAYSMALSFGGPAPPPAIVPGVPLIPPLRATFAAFAALALMAGFLLLPLAEDTDRWFSWTIQPPLTAAWLGAAYWAAFVLLAWTAWRGTWESARAALPPVFTIAVLLLVATLVHLDKFDLDSLFGWFWLVVYCLVPPALAVLVWLQLRSRGPGLQASGPALPGGLRAALAVQALALVGLGGALFAAPTEADSLWPWTLTPLTARAVGAFLIGFGLAAADAAAQGDSVTFAGAAYAYAALGAFDLLVVALHSGDLAGDAARTVPYLLFATGVVAVGLYGVGLARRADRASLRS
jgi:hypothetical protein